jgi:hypothetical protein
MSTRPREMTLSLAGESIFRAEFKTETSGIQRSDSHYTVMLNLGRCGFWYWLIDKMNLVLKRIRTAYRPVRSSYQDTHFVPKINRTYHIQKFPINQFPLADLKHLRFHIFIQFCQLRISLFASADFKSVIPHQRHIYIGCDRTTTTFQITCTPQASTLLPYYFEFNTRLFFFTFFRTENMGAS